MAASASFADFLKEQLAPLGHIATRRMFGATGVFCNGLMFALVNDDTLFLRVDEINKTMFQDGGSAGPLTYSRKGQEAGLPYWQVPDGLFDEPDTFLEWSRAALAAARRVAAAKKPARPRKPRAA